MTSLNCIPGPGQIVGKRQNRDQIDLLIRLLKAVRKDRDDAYVSGNLKY